MSILRQDYILNGSYVEKNVSIVVVMNNFWGAGMCYLIEMIAKLREINSFRIVIQSWSYIGDKGK